MKRIVLLGFLSVLIALPAQADTFYGIDATTRAAWAQQRNGNFAIQQFDIETATGIGAPIPNAASWHGLEYVGTTLYAAGFGGMPDRPSLATLNPATGASTVIAPFGIAEGEGALGLGRPPGRRDAHGRAGSLRLGRKMPKALV